MHDVDLKFIEKILRKYKNDDSIIIRDLCTTPACEKGENFMSVVLRISVKATRVINDEVNDYQVSLIAKRPYQSDLLQEAFQSNEIFINEVIAYNEIIPTLKKYSKLTLPLADCLYADKEVILLQDLTVEEYEMNRNQVTMTIDQCLAVIKELATFHSASIILKQERPDKIEQLSKRILEIYRHDNKAIINLVDKNISVALTLLQGLKPTEKILTAMEVLGAHREEIYQRVCDLIKSKDATSVFNHGDCWRNNILFNKTPSGINVKLIDLQVMRYASVAADLNYFLHINLLPAERNKNKDLILSTYIKQLQENLYEHGVDLDQQVYTKAWLEKQMANFAIFGFMSSLWISPAFYLDKNNLPDMESIRPEELDGDYHKEFILKHMTADLKDRIISIVLDFIDTNTF